MNPREIRNLRRGWRRGQFFGAQSAQTAQPPVPSDDIWALRGLSSLADPGAERLVPATEVPRGSR